MITQGGLGLPDRDYYLKNDAPSVEVRKEYVAHIARLLGLAGEADTTAKAEGVLALETELAELHWAIAKRRERDLTYNPHTRTSLEALAPSFPWADFLDEAQLGKSTPSSCASSRGQASPSCFGPSRSALEGRPHLSLLQVHATVLPGRSTERFAFSGACSTATPAARGWKRATRWSTAASRGRRQLYVEKPFPPPTSRVLKLVENLRAASASASASSLDGRGHQAGGLEKLSTFRRRSLPRQLKDYTALVSRPATRSQRGRAREFG